MDASQVRGQVWNWLPTFLAVAERGSVVGAAKDLGLTAAAVSRTVRLLEDRLGTTLFHRVGRSLSLSDEGARLRDALREAVQHVDDGLRHVDPTGSPRPLRVASLGMLTEHFVIPAALAVAAERPDVCPEHLNLRPAEAIDGLRKHEVDVAFYYEELVAEGVDVTRLGEASKSVYCGRGHALYDAAELPRTPEEIGLHPFSVPQVGDSGRPMDGWPSELPRRVGMRVTLLRSNLQVALSGLHLCVLPDVTAEPFVRERALRRLPWPELPPIALYAARRAQTGEAGEDPEPDLVSLALDELVDEVRRAVEGARRSPP